MPARIAPARTPFSRFLDPCDRDPAIRIDVFQEGANCGQRSVSRQSHKPDN